MGTPRKAFVVGGYQTRFGHLPFTWRELAQEAGAGAMSGLGIGPEQVEALFLGAGQPGRFTAQAHTAPLVAEQLGLDYLQHIARTEMACASGQSAVRHAMMAVASGMCDIALCIGVEKMAVDPADLATGLAVVLDREWDAAHGANAPPFFAMVAQRHMKEFGTLRDHLTAVAVKNRNMAVHNEKAQFRTRVAPDDVTGSAMVAPPLHLLDCCGTSDGAAAVIVASEERARELTDTPVSIKGVGQSVKGNIIGGIGDIVRWDHLTSAAHAALEMAGLSIADIDMAEVHDCFTISEIVITEDLGLCRKGDGGPFVADGGTAIGGKLPMNTRGGLLGMGHPLGATGISQILEVIDQMRGDVPSERAAGEVENAIVHNLSGAANVHSVMVLGREA